MKTQSINGRLVYMTRDRNIVIVGSGPAAYASCLAAIDHGIKPTVIFFGFSKPYWYRQESNKKEYLANEQIIKSHLTRKNRNNDSEMYRIHESSKIINENNLPLPISHYPGGLSSVWGANIATLSGDELKKWESESNDQRKAYIRILKEIDYVSGQDDLMHRFPIPYKKENETNICTALENLINSSRSEGILMGRARNASKSTKNGCTLCGKCLTGCPEDIIFDASKYIREMEANKKIEIVDGLVIDLKIKEDDTYQINLTECKNYKEIIAKKVIMACGSISTISILQNSNFLSTYITLDDSQVAYLPIINFKLNTYQSAKYTLAQVFVTSANEYEDFHLSIYESDELLKKRIIAILGNVGRIIPRILLNYLYPGILFMPTNRSGKILITKGVDGSRVTVCAGKDTYAYTEKTVNILKKKLRPFGFYVLSKFKRLGSVGSSYHIGTARDIKSNLIFDLDGRIKNGIDAKNLVASDSSSLPYVQTGPITLTIMANSYRISSKMIR
jgi:ferredoxin